MSDQKRSQKFPEKITGKVYPSGIHNTLIQFVKSFNFAVRIDSERKPWKKNSVQSKSGQANEISK